MAGSVVKWWKQKILQGYSKLSLLQECPTDCEELIYHNNCASSSLRLPPDLLLNNNNNKNNNRTTKSLPENCLSSNLHNNCKENVISNENSITQSNEVEYDEVDATFNTIKDLKNKTRVLNEISEKLTKNSARIKLEEFKCDVSVSEGKNQPLQFSFTFYDLDGHHNKITKDDITGIVYTIYESIGQNLIVPHCGSKTINVRLTVNPENSSKLKNKPSITNSNIKNNHLQQFGKNHFGSSAEEDTDGQSEKQKATGKNIKVSKASKIVKKAKNEDSNNKNISNRQIKISAHDDVAKENVKIKILRKTPKKKSMIPQHELRQRSLSVGNETRWNNNNSSQNKQRKVQGKCWNHSIKREELIDIIKESMEKNRLCFQSKPKANVTPVRQRSNTVTNSETTFNNKQALEANCHDSQQQQTHHQHHHHGSHHIPIYHQQLPINPAILQTIQNSIANGIEKPRNHLNLCGYDSHLHAKFCSSANSDSYASPPHLVPIKQTIPIQHSPVYQSISQNFSPKTYVQNSKHFQQFQHQHKRNPKKILNQQQMEKDGYQRLEPTGSTPTSMLTNIPDTQNTKLNTHILSSLNSELSAEEKINRIQFWLNQHEATLNKKDLKNYDNLLYARLSEKLLAVRKIDKRNRIKNKYNNTTIENNQNLSDQDKLVQEKFRLPEYNTDCENLINDSSDNDTMKSCRTKSNCNKSDSSMVKHRYVHEHYHHHYHHFENAEDFL